MSSVDFSSNTGLSYLDLEDNQLTSLDLSKTQELYAESSFRDQVVDVDGLSVDLAVFTSGFDANRVSNVTGGTLTGTVLSVATPGTISYTYAVPVPFGPVFEE